jgi:hypothetical protein
MQELLQARLLMRYSCILQAEVGTAVYTGDTAEQSCTVNMTTSDVFRHGTLMVVLKPSVLACHTSDILLIVLVLQLFTMPTYHLQTRLPTCCA